MPAQQLPDIPAIGYIRVSMLQEEQISPEIQRHAITDWASRRGRHIVEWIEDLDVSGRTFRRKIMNAVESIEAGRAREIVVWKFSRFGRNRTGQAINLGRVTAAGGDLVSATEEVDARTAVGKLTRGMLMELAAFESDRAGEQWAEAHANRRSRGLPATGRSRFGYTLRGRVRDILQKDKTVRYPPDGDERYEPNDQAPILADLYHRYTAGEGGRVLAGLLNDLGLRTARGNLYSKSTVLKMLDSGFGAGLLRIHDPNCDCASTPTCKNWVYIPGAHPAVITSQEWVAYRRRRTRSANTAPRARVSLYPVSGRIWCGHCRSPMTIVAEKGGSGWGYMCSSYLASRQCAARTARRLVVEDRLLSALKGWAEDIEAAAPDRPAVPNLRPDIDKARAGLKAAEAALVRLAGQLAKGLIPEDIFTQTRDELLAERAAAKTLVEELGRPAPRQAHDYLPVIEELVEEWVTLSAQRRREMVADLIAAIRVFRESRTSAWLEIESTWGQIVTLSISHSFARSVNGQVSPSPVVQEHC